MRAESCHIVQTQLWRSRACVLALAWIMCGCGEAGRLALPESKDPTDTAPGDHTGDDVLELILEPDPGESQDDSSGSSPFVEAGADVTVSAGERVVLDGTATEDPDNDELVFEWRQTDGYPAVALERADSPIAEFTAPDVEETTVLTFTLTVSDGVFASTDSTQVEILPQTLLPHISIEASTNSGFAPLEVAFTAVPDEDPPPDSVYRWTFADGGIADGAVVEHEFAVAGTYPVTACLHASVGSTDDATCNTVMIDVFALPEGSTDPPVGSSPGGGPEDDDTITYPPGTDCVLETQDFRLTITGTSGAVAEFVYLPSGGPLGPTGGRFVAAYPGGLDVPDPEAVAADSMTFVKRADGQKVLTFHFPGGQQVVLGIYERPSFLDFRLLEVVGSGLGDVAMMILRHNLGDIFAPDQVVQFTYLNDGLVLGLIGATNDTRPAGVGNSWRAYSMEGLPHPEYQRHQRFGVFVCDQNELIENIRTVEQHYGIPAGVDTKLDPANDLDYLMLRASGTLDAPAVIEACQRLHFQSVLLVCPNWCAWDDPTEPFKAQDGAAAFIASLQNAGLLVGCHTYLHKVHRDGYHAVTYPDRILPQIPPGEQDFVRTYDLHSDLPEIIAQDFANRYNQLGFDWVYFDGAEDVGDPVYGWATVDWYAVARTMRAALAAMNPPPRVVQSSYKHMSIWSYLSRMGQRDYLGLTNQMDRLDEIVAEIPMIRRNLYTPDLGWFNINVLTPDWETYRWATVDEVAYLCQVSLAQDAPIGLRTTIEDLLNHPDSDQIINMIGAAVAERQGL